MCLLSVQFVVLLHSSTALRMLTRTRQPEEMFKKDGDPEVRTVQRPKGAETGEIIPLGHLDSQIRKQHTELKTAIDYLSELESSKDEEHAAWKSTLEDVEVYSIEKATLKKKVGRVKLDRVVKEKNNAKYLPQRQIDALDAQPLAPTLAEADSPTDVAALSGSERKNSSEVEAGVEGEQAAAEAALLSGSKRKNVNEVETGGKRGEEGESSNEDVDSVDHEDEDDEDDADLEENEDTDCFFASKTARLMYGPEWQSTYAHQFGRT